MTFRIMLFHLSTSTTEYSTCTLVFLLKGRLTNQFLPEY